MHNPRPEDKKGADNGQSPPAGAAANGANGARANGATVSASFRSLFAIFIWVLVVALLLRYLPAVQFIVLVFLSAAILAALLRPLADRLPGSAHTQALLSVGILVIFLAGVLFLLGWTLYSPLQGYIKQWPALQDQMNRFLKEYSGALSIPQAPTFLEFLDQASRLLTGQSGGTLATHVLDAAFTIILGLMVVVVGAMYLIAEPRLMRPALKLLPPQRQGRMYRMLFRLQPQLRWYVIGQAAGMVMVGIVSAVGYLIVGLPFALPVAMFAALAEIVPTFGPMITLLVAALVGATAGLGKVAGALIVYAVVQTTESYVLVPTLMRKTVNVPPIVTLLTVVLWGNVFGPLGLVLAVPIDLVIWAMLEEFVIRAREEQARGNNHGPPG